MVAIRIKYMIEGRPAHQRVIGQKISIDDGGTPNHDGAEQRASKERKAKT
jgi:hypothetical protein